MGGFTSFARTLKEVQEEMDAPLEMTKTVMELSSGRMGPAVSVEKSAKWLDIERGYAQIDLSQEDSCGYSNQAVDYLIILDRTRTMSLNDKNFEGNPKDEISASHAPCLNRDHYYVYNGQMVDLYDYGNGIVRGTDQVVSIPLTERMYEQHRSADGHSISADYANGCVDRLRIAQNTIRDLIDTIAAHSPKDGAVKNRVSYWSFAGPYWPEVEGALDTDLEKGLYDYIALTSDYEAVKAKVQATNSYAGTYYTDSLKRVWEQLSSRSGVYQNMPSKVIFISDGKCADGDEHVMEWAEKVKKIPGCTLYTLAIGMPVNSEAAVLLKNMSSNQDATTFAAFTTNLNSEDSAFADTLTAIEAKTTEVKAKDKILTDKIDTRYWEFVEVLSADGEAQVKENQLVWKIPEGAGKTYRCSMKVRLKEAYRFLVTDTCYPTNLDTEEEKGCCLEYVVSGGPSSGETRRLEKETPVLKYGTLKITGEKYFTVADANAEKVLLYLKRKGTDGKEQLLLSEELNEKKGWKYAFDSRIEKGEKLPLVLYTNEQQKWEYFLKEESDFYQKIDEKTTWNGQELKINLYNEPYKIKAQVIKEDVTSSERLSGAIFGVYAFSKKTGTYMPYTGTDKAAAGDKKVVLRETSLGNYETENWLYYTPDNGGKFRIIEEQAPKGYVGDYKSENIKDGKNTYDIQITAENTGTVLTDDLAGNPLVVKNARAKGKLKVYKKDADSHLPIPQGKAELFYEAEEKNAVYGIFDENQELIEEKHMTSEGFLVFENLELGTYYVKELDNPPEGYLLNPESYPVHLEYKGQEIPVVIEELDVYEPVKKQTQVIYKVGGKEEDEEWSWILDAGFMVFPFSSLGDRIIGMTDEEILDYIDTVYRDPKTRTYETMKTLKSVKLYKNGISYEMEEIRSKDGTYVTEPLPYGDYIIAETTVPEDKRPVRPFIIHVREDEEDKITVGDKYGTPLKARVLRDEDVLSNIRIVKEDQDTGKTVKKGMAAYVIHDVQGSWKTWFFKSASLKEKAEYLLRCNGLVAEKDNQTGVWRGTYDNPYRTTEKIINGETMLAAETAEGIPTGLYEVEEVAAPEGYILQGKEGRIAVQADHLQENVKSFAENGTYHETQNGGCWKSTPEPAAVFRVGVGEGYYDTENNCWWTEVYQKNEPAIGKISLQALKETVDDKGEHRWNPIEGENFSLYAKEAIYAADGTCVYPAGALVETLTTDAQGMAWTGTQNGENGEPKGLYLGKYCLKGLKEERSIEVVYQDDKTPVIYKDEIFRIPLKHMETKKTPVTGDPVLPGRIMAVMAGSAMLAVGCLYRKKGKKIR